MTARHPQLEWSPGSAAPVLQLADLSQEPLNWWDSAACRDTDTTAFFPAKGGGTAYVKRLCATCPVASECLEDQMEFEGRRGYGRHGIWGGTTPEQRNRIAQQRKGLAA